MMVSVKVTTTKVQCPRCPFDLTLAVQSADNNMQSTNDRIDKCRWVICAQLLNNSAQDVARRTGHHNFEPCNGPTNNTSRAISRHEAINHFSLDG